MKNIIYILLLLFIIVSCESDYSVVSTEIVKGVITAKDEGQVGRIATLPKFYISSPKQIVTIDVPFADENLFHIGDTICVVVKTVKNNTDE